MSSVPQPTPATCPRCSGSGWIPLSGDSLRVEPCACQGDLRRRQRISASNIPRRYLTCRLRNFNESVAVLKASTHPGNPGLGSSAKPKESLGDS